MLTEKLWLKQRIFGSASDSLLYYREEMHTELIIEPRENDSGSFSLEEILSELTGSGKDIMIFPLSSQKANENIKNNPSIMEARIVLEEEMETEKRTSVKTKLLLYEISEGEYYVYSRKELHDSEPDSAYDRKTRQTSKDEKSYGMFVPSGVTVRRVSQNILGTGVLGRAFINSNYIEILDSLAGNEYSEVLTHEVFHIMYPEKHEIEIRQITRNYLGNTIYH